MFSAVIGMVFIIMLYTSLFVSEMSVIGDESDGFDD